MTSLQSSTQAVINTATVIGAVWVAWRTRSPVIQARNALQGMRSVAVDSETYLCGVIDLSKVSEDEFERWLYGYHQISQ